MIDETRRLAGLFIELEEKGQANSIDWRCVVISVNIS